MNSIQVLKKGFILSGKNILSRSLIIIQFTIAVFFIIGTVFLYKQNQLLMTKDLGFNSNNIISVSLESVSDDAEKNHAFVNAFKSALKPYNQVSDVTGAVYSLSSFWMSTAPNLKGSKNRFIISGNNVDIDYIDLFEMEIIQGRNFSQNHPSDFTSSIIVNETLLKKVGFTGNPIGKDIDEFFEESVFGETKIIGVVKDFHYHSLAQPIMPAFIILNDKHLPYGQAYVKFSGNIKENLKLIESQFKILAPNTPFEFDFLDDKVAAQYTKEKQWHRIVTSSSLLSITIACLGLFGLTYMVVMKRTKEIGIRKVLGASVPNITRLVNKEFISLIFISNLLAWPAVFFAVNKYLQNYAYKIEMEWWVFVFSGLCTIAIAVVTISIHAIKAAYTNPVDVIKDE